MMCFWKCMDRPFYWCQKVVKKLWLSWGYLELKKAKIPCETKSCGISYHLKWTTYLNMIGKRWCVSESAWTGLSIGAKKLWLSWWIPVSKIVSLSLAHPVPVISLQFFIYFTQKNFFDSILIVLKLESRKHEYRYCDQPFLTVFSQLF